MTRSINRDTRLCMSLSGRPGNFGTRFQNYLYEALDLNYVYKAFTTHDLPAAIGGIRALGIRGCAVSMPFKEACMTLVDSIDDSAAAIASVNTIVNDDGHLRAYNTDYLAVRSLIEQHGLGTDLHLALRGSGGMAKAVVCAFRDAGFRQGHVVARNETTGRNLAQTSGFGWVPDMSSVQADLLINVTPIGMEGPESDQFAFQQDAVERAKAVFDVVALPAETPLIKLARSLGKPVITGAEVIVLQAVEQFVLYTGVRPDDVLIARAAEHALS
ncbi:shikimate 5-dehydrogenase [Dyella sp.]|uniref:shikimate 5-dehydrogenase n=1 Tax=Dyella sp. TaxID=1869338 RepID=UPI002FDA4244